MATLEKMIETKGMYPKEDMKLCDAKGMNYNIVFDAENKRYAVIGSFSTMSFCRFFSAQEVAEEKYRQVDETIKAYGGKVAWVDRKKMVFSAVLQDSICGKHLAWLDALLDTWRKVGLAYVIEPNHKRVVFDISDAKFTPNYLWALRGVFYRFVA